MKLIVASTLLVVLTSLAAQAQTAPPPASAPASEPAPAAQKRADYVVGPESTEVVERDSSAYHRIDKTFQITAMLFGVGPSVSSTQGVELGYFLDRKSLVLLQFTKGSLSSSANVSIGGSQSGANLDFKTTSIGAHFKRHVGNSFYYRGGVDLRQADFSYTYTGTTTDFYKWKGSSVALNFQIGNQWQWSNFTLGCDWIGLSLPLTSSIFDESYSATAPTYYRDDAKRDQDFLVKGTHINLLRFYLGASF